jgi:hypothetical protein
VVKQKGEGLEWRSPVWALTVMLQRTTQRCPGPTDPPAGPASVMALSHYLLARSAVTFT